MAVHQHSGHSKIAYVLKAHKLQGAVKIKFIESPELVKLSDFLFLDKQGSLLPYAIAKLEHIPNEMAILRLKDLDNKNDADQLKGCSIYIKGEIESSNTAGKHIGYTIIDNNTGNKGVIDDVLDLPNNKLAVVNDGEEIYIPLNDNLIVETNDTDKTITMDLPEGIWSVNTANDEEE